MIAICLLAAPFAAGAQQPGRIPRIGVLYASSASVATDATRAFGAGSVSSVMSTARASCLRFDGQRGRSIARERLPPNWSASRSM